MDSTKLTYPLFEANQVLTSAHLNDLFEYLDEQTRLTRANLIGIGIVCGLEVGFEAPGTVRLSKGCGVTSQGYLIVEPADLALAHVRPYKLPIEYGYQPFVEPGLVPAKQYDLWELFDDDDEPGAQPLATSGLVLEDKAVVLFLERRKDHLRNCSPNNCDDRGAEVTATVRRLLIDVADLDTMNASAAGFAPTYLGADLTERLDLPDVRMPRFDVPGRGPVRPEQVLRAFQETFRRDKLVASTAAALTALYDAFKPLVVDKYPDNPFAGLANRFGFLDTTPATTAQVRFMQYYWDLFDDMLAAYDELRWKGVDLMCACAPPEGLFPRHLMAGVLAPANYDYADYRHPFVPSPAVGGCKERTRDLRTLFARLVAILAGFTETPPDKGIRATPSRWGDAPLSVKAIPYYYDQDGNPPVFQLWDPVRTTRRRANQNLSYRADEYSPAPPDFVTDPLRFDLEPNNFLRIEGHLGKNVHTVLESLLSLRKSHRLPFEVIALRTGAFDEDIEVDLGKEDCRFQDLETLYETLKSELTCFLVKQVMYFYSLPAQLVVGEGTAVPSLGLLKSFAPDFIAQPGTLGREIEAVLTWERGRRHPFVFELPGVPHFPSRVLALVGAMSDLSARLGDDIRQLDFVAFGGRYEKLLEIARGMEDARREGIFNEPGLSDRLDDILFRCRLDPFEALAAEYRRRVREVKQAQFLSHFLERHPGLQHKAGVPLGGTFILVYHELAQRGRVERSPRTPARPDVDELDVGVFGDLRARPDVDEARRRLSNAFDRLQYDPRLAGNPDVQLVYKAFTGNVLVYRGAVSKFSEQVYLDAIAGLPDGSVIADFFLPYGCCSDCQPIQFQLPQTRIRVSAGKACTDAEGRADVTLTTEGTSGSLSVQVDGGRFEETTGSLLLDVGEHTIVIRDATGSESSPVAIVIPPQLVIGAAQTIVDQAAGTYHVVASVQGGTPPYAVDPGTVVDTTYTSPLLPVADVLNVVVKDAASCAVERTFQSGTAPCDLPCDGVAERGGYRFWLPEARPRSPINDYEAEVRAFAITDPDGNQVDLTGEAVDAINRAPNPIRSTDFAGIVGRWLNGLNRLIADRFGSDQWFHVEYEPAPGSGTTGSLFVDRLSCVDFRFELAVTFVQDQRERAFELSYTSRGTVVIESSAQSKLRIPLFDGSTSNKCRPDDPPIPRCEGTDLTLELRREGAFPDVVILEAAVFGADAPEAFLWEVQDGIPSVAGGERVELTFEPAEPVEKLVRLTAYTGKGCTVSIEQRINIVRREG
ncbi:hypothetical protein [Arthrobacter sp. H20]|uniref:hypothetical protein n=1 Tax=Arthrobacter sp. H20 TaxID=1267981 RepID=UPI00047DD925|nr:hypothetical protein [Arthrobacter sp. H20]